ncbi:MAG: bifunctional phosphoglucose/phosphomannose isomerase [Candidatus Omnitrophica bacterium]|nr:bifunctional phosphoglucose/phosphomannose isomerase [Candidatus Omnitrophota bacterium]
MDKERIEKYDTSHMLALLLGFRQQCDKAVTIAQSYNVQPVDRSFENMIFLGMGGSAMGGELLKSYLQPFLEIPVAVNRGYTVPEWVSDKTIAIALSFSGNTEETLSAYRAALKKKAFLITVSSGGRLHELSEKDGCLHMQIPAGMPPRCALGYLTLIPLRIIERLGVIDNQDAQIAETLHTISLLLEELSPEVKAPENLAKTIAGVLQKNFPVIYASSDVFYAVAYRWCCQIAENAKQLAWCHYFPEMNHNEIVGWEHPKELLHSCKVVMLRDSMEYDRTKKRIEVVKGILSDNKVRPLEVFSRGKGLLSRLFSLIYIGDFVSFYLALLNEVDPTPISKIDHLKKSLGPFSL